MNNSIFEKGYLKFSLKDLNNELFNQLDSIYDENEFKWTTLVCTTDFKTLDNNLIEGTTRNKDYITGENIEQFYKNIIKNKIDFHQMFYIGECENMVFKRLSSKIIRNIIENTYNIKYRKSISTMYTLFTQGCKINKHVDGIMDGRLCAILVYLNKEYTNGDGGELKVNDKTIEPIFGDVVIMDYTKNNVEHSVNEVLNDKFKRRAILYFANI